MVKKRTISKSTIKRVGAKKPLSLRALDECKKEVKDVVREVKLPQTLFDRFIAEFEFDFSAMLDKDRGPVIWRANRKFFTNRARQLGTRAEYHALNEGKTEITEKHLRRGLRDVKPECDAPRDPDAPKDIPPPVRYEGCLHVSTDDPPETQLS